MNDYLTRINGVINEKELKALQNKTVLIAGLGGVGGAAFISLVRSGIKNFILIDFDQVEITNLNRQILYTSNDLGRQKVDVAKEYALKISQDLNILTLNYRISDDFEKQISSFHLDYLIDAIDELNAKLVIARYAFKNNIPLIISLGMGLRKDSTQVMIKNLNQTFNDPLAKKLRKLFKENDLDISKIETVFSSETPLHKEKEFISSIIFVPLRAGSLIAERVFYELIKSN